MNIRNRKLMSLLFMFVFTLKMFVSAAPLLSTVFDSGTTKAAIMQLEQENKGEKENTDKESFKEKKTFDEHLLAVFHFDPFLIQTNFLHNREHALLVQLFHPVVPTPPPNA